MLFVLSEEFRFAETAISANALVAIERLASAVFDGKHLLQIEHPRVVDELLSRGTDVFGAQTRAVLRKAKAEFALSADIQRRLGGFVRVVPEEIAFHRLAPDSYELPLHQLRQFNCSSTVLLAENLTDSKILAFAARHWLTEEKIRSVSVIAIERGAGGSQIPAEFGNAVATRSEIVLAITDGDHLHPTATKSHASRQCDYIVLETDYPTRHESLDVRELENLAPVNLLRDLTGPQNQDLAISLERLISSVPEVRVCGDIKDGTMGCKMFLLEEGAHKAWLSALAAHPLVRPLLSAQCTDGETCARGALNPPQACGCRIVPSLEPGFSERFLVWLETQSAQKALEAFKGDWRNSWLRVGKVVACWCAGHQPMNL